MVQLEYMGSKNETLWDQNKEHTKLSGYGRERGGEDQIWCFAQNFQLTNKTVWINIWFEKKATCIAIFLSYSKSKESRNKMIYLEWVFFVPHGFPAVAEMLIIIMFYSPSHNFTTLQPSPLVSWLEIYTVQFCTVWILGLTLSGLSCVYWYQGLYSFKG